MSPRRPSAYPRPDGLWGRRLLALTIGAAVAAGTAAALLRAPSFAVDDLQLVIWLLIGARLLEKRWWPRRQAHLAWRPRVAGRYAAESGLVARRSLAGWVDAAADLAWVLALALGAASLLPDEPRWARVARVMLLAGTGVGVGRLAYREVRFTGRLALTADGVRQGHRRYAWSNIDRASLRTEDGRVDGVRLRLIERQPLEPAPVVGGRSVAVPDERLLAAIDHFHARPEALAVGLPVTAPEPASGC